VDIDFPAAHVKRSYVGTVVSAIRLTRDPDAYSTELITGEGIRVYRIVIENDKPVSLNTLNMQKR
jgi:hypothetical protein